MHTWLVDCRARVASKSPPSEASAYIPKYWDGLKLLLADGRIEIDNNSVERTIRPIALDRKDASQSMALPPSPRSSKPAGSMSSPFAYLAATLTATVNGHKQSRIEELLPWNSANKAA